MSLLNKFHYPRIYIESNSMVCPSQMEQHIQANLDCNLLLIYSHIRLYDTWIGLYKLL